MEPRKVFDMFADLTDSPSKLKSVKSISRKVIESSITEAIGDNSVDNMMDQLKTSLNVEMSLFVAALLNVSTNKFLFAYNIPQYEGFSEAFKTIIQRYQVMDGTEQGDLFAKIQIMFKDLFIDKYGAMGAESAEFIANKYANQMIQELKKNSIQANTEINQDKENVPY